MVLLIITSNSHPQTPGFVFVILFVQMYFGLHNQLAEKPQFNADGLKDFVLQNQ